MCAMMQKFRIRDGSVNVVSAKLEIGALLCDAAPLESGSPEARGLTRRITRRHPGSRFQSVRTLLSASASTHSPAATPSRVGPA
jgi:hypothetical protein